MTGAGVSVAVPLTPALRPRAGGRLPIKAPLYGVVIACLFVLVWVTGLPSALGGQVHYVTTHGTSMEPRFHTGDLAIVRAAARYRVGEVAAYHSDLLKTVVMHRIVAVQQGHYSFKGDNNSWLDADTPTRDRLIGTLVVRVPHGGLVLGHLTSPTALGLYAFALLAGGGTLTRTRRKKRRGLVSRHAARPARSTSSMAALTSPVRTAAAVTVLVALLGATLGALAWTRPVQRRATIQEHISKEMTFSYTAPVPHTAAYDGATLTSPDPVFRALVDSLDVRFSYRGAPGSVAVDAELSTPSGWHSTVSLSPPKPFTTRDYEGVARLDLQAIAGRAQAAAKVTGIPADRVSVAVVPHVRTRDGAVFAPRLKLTLTPLQLTLADPGASLHTKTTTAVPTTAILAQSLDLLGRHLSVATARVLSLVLLLGALLALGLITVLARSAAPVSEGAGIRRRYAALLLAVHPMPSPPGRPMIDVTDFATLAKLAEHYGLLVMHWARSEVETFVVQDEGATYRYRTGPAPLKAVDAPSDLGARV